MEGTQATYHSPLLLASKSILFILHSLPLTSDPLNSFCLGGMLGFIIRNRIYMQLCPTRGEMLIGLIGHSDWT
jgi:hypothetical protein